ncbi:hypothetical protein PHK61_31425 [Actinomycetospora lutea]|uniref:hypothetical protein n=1 Tax=Actinomycetospora lutea TaxID=663604 RepID=UPI0023672545|nr:hypothetical protein [Actinomycetospora lutea]MDD7942930.1 hypothetical protein [Actinomycetospora lutea]
MADSAQCIRCGRVTSVGLNTAFIRWRLTPNGQAICPHGLTPSETVDDDTSVLTDSPDDQLLRDLDPDNDADDDQDPN